MSCHGFVVLSRAQFLFDAYGLNLRLHSHETLFDAYGLNLRMQPHEFLFDAYGLNLRMHPHEFLFDAKFLESFDWVPPMSYHPDSGMPIESTQLRPECDFVCTPTHTTWIPPKSIVERFRCLLRDFRF